jgi:hypothetical protein
MNKYFQKDFLGKLFGKNISSLSKESFMQLLINENIYIEKDIDLLNPLMQTTDSFTQFPNDFYYQKTDYKINPNVIKGLYKYCLMQLRLFQVSNKVHFAIAVRTRIQGISNDIHKIEILKNYRTKKILKSIKFQHKLGELAYYFIEHYDYQETGWDFLQQQFLSSEFKDYLTLKILNNDIILLDKFKIALSQNNQIEVYNEIINNLEKGIAIDFRKEVQENPLGSIIFKKDAEQIFLFFVLKYPKNKNTAFFSYLYHYFRDNLKMLNTITDDNLDYRNYVIARYQISFVRIQIFNSRERYHFKKIEMNNLFDDYYMEYCSVNSETKLSNNE